MAEAGQHLLTARNINFISIPFNKSASKFASQTFKIKASSNRNNISLRRSGKPPRRRLITISTSGSKWQGKWTCDYLLSLQDLDLEDLVEDGNKHAHVFINLCIEKNINQRMDLESLWMVLKKVVIERENKHQHKDLKNTVLGSMRKDISNLNMQVLDSQWMERSTHPSLESVVRVLRRTAERGNREINLPEIGGDDPSVIYVKPGLEADLDSLVRDTIRLTTATKDTCSELCEKSQPTVEYIGAQNAASINKRWSRLLELRKSNI